MSACSSDWLRPDGQRAIGQRGKLQGSKRCSTVLALRGAARSSPTRLQSCSPVRRAFIRGAVYPVARARVRYRLPAWRKGGAIVKPCSWTPVRVAGESLEAMDSTYSARLNDRERLQGARSTPDRSNGASAFLRTLFHHETGRFDARSMRQRREDVLKTNNRSEGARLLARRATADLERAVHPKDASLQPRARLSGSPHGAHSHLRQLFSIPRGHGGRHGAARRAGAARSPPRRP